MGSVLRRDPGTSLCLDHTRVHSPVVTPTKGGLRVDGRTQGEREGETERCHTIVNFPFPNDTRSLRDLALEPLVWPRNGVLITIPDLAEAKVEAIFLCWCLLLLSLSVQIGVVSSSQAGHIKSSHKVG